MISLLRRFRRELIGSVVVIFIVGVFAGLGGYFFTGADTTEAVATVGKQKIPYLLFRVRVNQYLDALRARGDEVTPEVSQTIKSEMLRDMIVNEILAQQAEKMGLKVSDTELALTIRQTPGFQREGQFDQDLYFAAVRSAFKTTPEAYEKTQRRALLAGKLKALLFRSAKLAPGELREEFLRAGGKIQEFDAKREAFARELQQRRALDAVNFFLRQLGTELEVRSYLEQRERGL